MDKKLELGYIFNKFVSDFEYVQRLKTSLSSYWILRSL